MTNCTATKQQLKSLGRSDEGQALVMGALALVVLVLMAGLGVDVGFLRYQRMQMQKAADAGAIAGAAALIYGGQVTLAAQNDTAANGFANGNNGITVSVNNPPQSGPFSGLNAYVEVIVAQAEPTFFMRVGGFNSVNIRGRAVASSIASSSGCIYALDPVSSDAFTALGPISVNSTCGIRVNSNSGSAFHKTGSGNIYVINGGIGVVGGVDESGSGTISPTPVEGIPPFIDPLAGVPAPSVGNCKYTNYVVDRPGNSHLSQGVYCGGITVTYNGPVTFDSGTYVLLGGGMHVSPTYHPVLTGSEVTFYNTGDGSHQYQPVTITGAAGTNLSAPTSGTLNGILFFQDRLINVCCGSATVNSFDASRGEIYTGALYFPTSPIKYRGNETFPPYTIIDAWWVKLIGTSAINNNYSSLYEGASPIHSAALVE